LETRTNGKFRGIFRMKKVTPLFSKAFCVDELKLTDNQVNKIINIIKKLDYTKVGKIENGQAYNSNNFYVLDNSNLSFLKKIIENNFKKFMKDDLSYTNNFKLTTSWIAKIEPGGYSHWHNHNNCFYSGVLYLTTNENGSGNIIFNTFSNNRFELQPKEWNIFNSKTFSFCPKTKEVIYFPAEIFHKVEQNTTQSTRYSLAFNFMPIGKLGSCDSELKI